MIRLPDHIDTPYGRIRIINYSDFIYDIRTQEVRGAPVNEIYYPISVRDSNPYYNAFNPYGEIGHEVIQRRSVPLTRELTQDSFISSYTNKRILKGSLYRNINSIIDSIKNETRRMVGEEGIVPSVFVDLHNKKFLLTNPDYYTLFVAPHAIGIACTKPEFDNVYELENNIKSSMPLWF